MNLLFVCPSLSIDWGGPTDVIENLGGLLEKELDTELRVCTTTDPVTDKIFSTLKNIILVKRDYLSALWIGFSFKLIYVLWIEVSRAHIIHIHELWHFPGILAALYARIQKKSYCISTHGGLDPGCFSEKKVKKKLFFFLFQKNILIQASKVFVLSQRELQMAKILAPSINSDIIPNGVSKKFLVEKKIKKQKYLLFLGRLHQIKGLFLLVEAFAGISKKYTDYTLVLAGPDGGVQSKLKTFCHQLNIQDKVLFPGLVKNEAKWKLLKEATVFVLPSYGEAFGIVILEALAAGTPVVVTEACGVPGIEEAKIGKVVPIDASALQSAIEFYLQTPVDIVYDAINFIEANYQWETLVKIYLETYKRI